MAYRYYSTLRPLMVGGIPFPKECPDRHPGCHDRCERYAENKAAYQKLKQEYDESVRNPYCRRWTHRAIVRSFKKKFR